MEDVSAPLALAATLRGVSSLRTSPPRPPQRCRVLKCGRARRGGRTAATRDGCSSSVLTSTSGVALVSDPTHASLTQFLEPRRLRAGFVTSVALDSCPCSWFDFVRLGSGVVWFACRLCACTACRPERLFRLRLVLTGVVVTQISYVDSVFVSFVTNATLDGSVEIECELEISIYAHLAHTTLSVCDNIYLISLGCLE